MAGLCVVRVCVCSVVCVCVECVHTPTPETGAALLQAVLKWDGPVTRVEVCVAAEDSLREGAEVGLS